MKDNLEDLFDNSEELHKNIPETKPPKLEQPSISEKIKNFGMALMSRGFTNKRCSPLVKQVRSLSCHGNKELAPCPHRKDSEKFEGSHYCGGCGCGDKKMTQLSPLKDDKDNYGKLDFPAVSCPLKMPGFTDYQMKEDDHPDIQRRKEYINRMYVQIGVDMDTLAQEQKNHAAKRRKQLEKDKEKKKAKRDKAKAKIEKLQKKFGFPNTPSGHQIFNELPDTLPPDEAEQMDPGETVMTETRRLYPNGTSSDGKIHFYTKDPETGQITARGANGQELPMPGQVIEINQHNMDELVKQGKGADIVEAAQRIPERKGGCSSCAKKKAARERRNLKKEKTSPPPIDNK